jgi:hypothetical protein
LSIDKNKRQRGSDEPHAPLLLEEDDTVGEGDVVIGRKEGDQGDHGASCGFQQALGIKDRSLAWGRKGWRGRGLRRRR